MNELDKFTLPMDEFKHLFSQKETQKLNLIYLDKGKTRFDEYTLNPHGTVTAEFLRQVYIQDGGHRLLDGSFGRRYNIPYSLANDMKR